MGTCKPAGLCRCGERLVLGPGSVSSQGDMDAREVAHIAREMIFTCGFSPALGPVALMKPQDLGAPRSDEETAASEPRLGSSVSRIALSEVDQVGDHAVCMSAWLGAHHVLAAQCSCRVRHGCKEASHRVSFMQASPAAEQTVPCRSEHAVSFIAEHLCS